MLKQREPGPFRAVVLRWQAQGEAVMSVHWKGADDPREIMRATGHPELEYAAGWTIAGLVTLGVIVAAWVFAI